MSMEQEYLRRIAASLERIADQLCEDALRGTGATGGFYETAMGRCVPTGVACSATSAAMMSNSAYETAVQALVDMPNDIPPEPAVKAKPVTKADVIAALNKFAAVHGIAAGKKVLNQFGAKLNDIDPAQYGDLVKLLEVTK